MYPAFTKIILLSSFILCISLNQSYPQQVKWGKLLTSESKSYTPHIMGDDENFIYSTSTVEEKIYIEKFDKNTLNRQYSKLIDHPKINGQELEYEGIYFMKDKFVIFASLFNSKDNNSNIYAYVYNAAEGKKAGDPRMVLTVEVEKSKRKGSFYVFVSKDRTKILVNHAGYYKKEKCIKDKYLLMNDKLEPITEKEDKIFKDELDYSTFNYSIDNEGSFYYIKNMNSGASFIVSYDANKDYEKWEAEIDLSDIDRKTKVIRINFVLNSENDLILVGYYTLDKKNISGTFLMKVRTASKEIIFKKTNAFDNGTLKKLVVSNSVRASSNKEPKIPIECYNATGLLAKNDGGIIMFGEEAYNYSYKQYIFQDVIVLCHSAEGELMWASRIPKYQDCLVKPSSKPGNVTRKQLEFSSYFPVIQNNKLNIYQNERKDDVTKSDTEMAKLSVVKTSNLNKMKKTLPVCYSYDLISGEAKKSEMLPKIREKIYFKPKVSYQKNYDTDVIFFSQYKKSYKLGVLMD